MEHVLEDDVRIALETLPTGSNVYDLAYKDAMERIAQDPNGEKLAKQVLGWITCAKWPLLTTELQHALATKSGQKEFNIRKQPDVDDKVSVCAGLVTVDNKSGIIRLVHNTTQEYLERPQGKWLPDVETEITETCVTYLSFNAFEGGFCQTFGKLEERLQSYKLYKYAAH
ncbi:ankyrin repeat protein, partial [Dactylonectria estremocensis]